MGHHVLCWGRLQPSCLRSARSARANSSVSRRAPVSDTRRCEGTSGTGLRIIGGPHEREQSDHAGERARLDLGVGRGRARAMDEWVPWVLVGALVAVTIYSVGVVGKGLVDLRQTLQTVSPSAPALEAIRRQLVRLRDARIGHMHRNDPPLDLQDTLDEFIDQTRADPEPEPEWIIVDSAGKELARFPAKRIVDRGPGEPADPKHYLNGRTIVRQTSRDPVGARVHEATYRQKLLADAERAARSVFPVCRLRPTECGYDILL